MMSNAFLTTLAFSQLAFQAPAMQAAIPPTATLSTVSLLATIPPVATSPAVSQPVHRVVGLRLSDDGSTIIGAKQKQPVTSSHASSPVYGLRKFPYPYDAMLAVSSDADHETVRKFELVHEFLNTSRKTPMGKGLNLDMSDSVFMYNASNIPGYVDANRTPLTDEMSYFVGTSTTRKDAKRIDGWIHKGWIDTLHSYGDFSMRNQYQTRFSRKLAVQAIDALRNHRDFLAVWTDHGNMSNVDNFGRHGSIPFYNYQQGALPRSPYYHTDLTIPYGVHFVWTDGHSDVFGRSNMIYPLRLPSGQRVWGFHRYTNAGYNKFHHLKWVWSQDYISKELTHRNLQSIIRHHEFSIVAQHFEADNTTMPFSKSSIAELRQLASLQQQGKILVAGTARLLNYNVANRYATYQVSKVGKVTVIDITTIHDPVFGNTPATLNATRGLTFYVANPATTELEVAGKPLPTTLVQRNPSDGRHASIEIKWWKSH